jgi:methyl-accepting chemotaxis protein
MKLKSLCSPVLALMRRLSYGRLFTLVGAVLLAPLAYLLYLQVNGTDQSITFNQKEAYGVENIEPARELLQEASRRRLQLTASAKGEQRFDDELATQKRRMRDIAARLETVTKRLGPAMADLSGEQKTVARAKDLLAALQATEVATGDQVDSSQRELIAVLNDFILNYVGNYSNLILDPDLDSYYLMDAYTGRLANLTDAIVSAATILVGRLQEGVLVDADRIELAGQVARARGLVGDLRINFQSAFQNNPAGNLKPALGEPVAATLAEVESFLITIDAQALGNGKATLAAVEFCDRASQLVDTVQKLYVDVGPLLTDLIETRVERYSTAKTLGLVSGGIAVLLTIWVLLSFYFQVSSELAGKIKEAQELRGKAEAENQLLNTNIMDLLTFVANCADGNLTGRAKVTEGALGNVADALNQMMDNWEQVLGTLIKTVDETQSAGRQIGATAERMAAGATEQAQKLEAATGTVQQIRGNIHHVSENASTASTAASRTQESAFNGSEMVQKIADEMESLRANVQAGAKKIKSLGDRSMEITGIVGTIAKISEQTNMLALNAAIEAARAGEHGRGFSVVAEEVRKLAERTSMATQDIKGLITSIQAETTESVDAIEQQTRAVEHHAESVADSGQVLQKIHAESTQTSELIADMNRIARGQVPVAEQTLQSMLAVSDIAKETQASAQTTLKLSQVLSGTADRLVGAISNFKIKI